MLDEHIGVKKIIFQMKIIEITEKTCEVNKVTVDSKLSMLITELYEMARHAIYTERKTKQVKNENPHN